MILSGNEIQTQLGGNILIEPFEERLLYVTHNLVQYGEYGKDIIKASKVVPRAVDVA